MKKSHFYKCLVLLCVMMLMTICASAVAEEEPVLSLNETTITLVKGKTVKLTPSVSNVENAKKLKYTWESSDPSVVTVTNGSLKAVDGGSAVITCSTVLENGSAIQSSSEVTVTVPVTSIKLLSDKQLTIQSGSTSKVKVDITPQNATDQSLEWESSDSSIATVDKDGVITANSAGKATITAVTKDGSKKKIQVSVYVPSLFSSVTSVNVNSFEGKSIDCFYYGKNWNNDIKLAQKGDAFTYSISGDGNKYTISFMPASAGTGSLTISDLKDSKSKLQFDVSVTSGAIQVNQYVRITKATCKNGNFTFSYKNNTGMDIVELCFYVLPFNQFNEILYYDTYGEQPRFYFIYSALKSNGTSSFRGWSGLYAADSNVDHVEIALDSLRFSNGDFVQVADADYHWFSSKMNAYKTRPARNAVNTTPSDVINRKAESFRIGCTYDYYVREWDKVYYGYKHSGQAIATVAPGSIAYKAGLRPGDLIVSVDGILYSDDPYNIARGKAKIADGEKVVFVIERYAQEGTIHAVLKK